MGTDCRKYVNACVECVFVSHSLKPITCSEFTSCLSVDHRLQTSMVSQLLTLKPEIVAQMLHVLYCIEETVSERVRV